jgi:hypothetical protein
VKERAPESRAERGVAQEFNVESSNKKIINLQIILRNMSICSILEP